MEGIETGYTKPTHAHKQAAERLCINLLYLNIPVSVPRQIAVMQHVWRISKSILFSELPPDHQFPLNPTLQREEKLPTPATAKWGEHIQTQFSQNSTCTHTHTQATELSHPRALGLTLGELSLMQLTAEWNIHRDYERQWCT